MKQLLLSTAFVMVFTASVVAPDSGWAELAPVSKVNVASDGSVKAAKARYKKNKRNRAPVVIVLPAAGKTKTLVDGYTLDSVGNIKNPNNELVAILSDKGVFTNTQGEPFSNSMQLKLLGLMGTGLDFSKTGNDYATQPDAPATKTDSAPSTTVSPAKTVSSTVTSTIKPAATTSTSVAPVKTEATTTASSYTAPVKQTVAPVTTTASTKSIAAPASSYTAPATTSTSSAPSTSSYSYTAPASTTKSTGNNLYAETKIATPAPATETSRTGFSKPTAEYNQAMFGNTQRGQLRILAVGDSMTAGQEDAPDGFRSYRGQLGIFLKDAGYQVDFVGTKQGTPAVGGDPDHDGYGGAYIGPGGNAHNIYDRLTGIFSATDPNLVIAAMGWNSAYNESAAAAGASYRGLIQRIAELKPNAVIIVATLSPQRGETEAQTSAQLPAYAAINEAARELANASPTDQIFLADFASAGFQGDDFWDVIHWLQPGADKAANVLAQTITSIWYAN